MKRAAQIKSAPKELQRATCSLLVQEHFPTYGPTWNPGRWQSNEWPKSLCLMPRGLIRAQVLRRKCLLSPKWRTCTASEECALMMLMVAMISLHLDSFCLLGDCEHKNVQSMRPTRAHLSSVYLVHLHLTYRTLIGTRPNLTLFLAHNHPRIESKGPFNFEAIKSRVEIIWLDWFTSSRN